MEIVGAELDEGDGSSQKSTRLQPIEVAQDCRRIICMSLEDAVESARDGMDESFAVATGAESRALPRCPQPLQHLWLSASRRLIAWKLVHSAVSGTPNLVERVAIHQLAQMCDMTSPKLVEQVRHRRTADP